MDYKKLAEDLLSECEENCADCEYAGDIEYECAITQLAAKAITELLARAEAAEVGEKDAEYRMNCYKVFFDSVSKTPDCNTCADRQCKYRPKPGQTTRFNCPLWRGSED